MVDLLSVDRILTVLSNPMRRRILELLYNRKKPLPYTDIWGHFDMSSTGSLNHHLRTLADRGLIVRQSTGYTLTPRGRIAHAVYLDIEASYRKNVSGNKRNGEKMDRSISIKPVEKGDMFELVLKAGTMTDKGPLSEDQVKVEKEQRGRWLNMEARGIHGRRISSVVNLLAVENGHAVGNISGREERIDGLNHHTMIIDNITSLGDPLVAGKLLSGLLDHAQKRGVESISFNLNDPQDSEEQAIAQHGGKLCHEATNRYFVLNVKQQ